MIDDLSRVEKSDVVEIDCNAPLNCSKADAQAAWRSV